jgi:hypothetical protein
MDALYSGTLFVASGLAVIGALAGVMVLCRPGRILRRTVLLCVVVALVFGVVSIAVHLWYGHGPGTPEPMDLRRFLDVHPAYSIVVMLSSFSFLAALLSRQRRHKG